MTKPIATHEIPDVPIHVAPENGHVVLQFGRALSELHMPPWKAVELARALLTGACEARFSGGD